MIKYIIDKKNKLFNYIKENKFSTILFLLLVFLFFAKLFFEQNIDFSKKDKENLKNNYIENEIQIFVQDSCIHCKRLKEYIKENDFEKKYNIKYYNLNKKENFDMLSNQIFLNKINSNNIGTPMIFSKTNYIIGFDESKEGKENLIKLFENNKEIENTNRENYLQKTIKIPFYGEVDLFELSLPLLTIIVGLADGFNPCAMWVLVYLLSITISLKDKKKIWVLVGNFVFTSGVLYFLFMTAWLNVFLIVGYLRLLNLIIGCVALYYGTNMVYEFIKNKGEVVCKLENNETRNKSMSKIRTLINSDISISTILGIMFLAFVVNSFEFVCSSALPATYTYLITRSNLSTIQYYLYILLYDVFYMFDDIIVFSVAAFTLSNYTGKNYEKYSTIIGGFLMIIIGIFIVFFPNLLK